MEETPNPNPDPAMSYVPVLLQECPDLIKSTWGRSSWSQSHWTGDRSGTPTFSGGNRQWRQWTPRTGGSVYDEQDPSKPLPEGYVMASLVYSGHLGGTTWNDRRTSCYCCSWFVLSVTSMAHMHLPKDCPLKNSNIRFVPPKIIK